MSKISGFLLLFLALPFLVACPSDQDIEDLWAANDSISANLQALTDSLRVYLVDGRPGDPGGTPPTPAYMGLGEWTQLMHTAFCAEHGDSHPEVCTETGPTDPTGRPPPPPGL